MRLSLLLALVLPILPNSVRAQPLLGKTSPSDLSELSVIADCDRSALLRSRSYDHPQASSQTESLPCATNKSRFQADTCTSVAEKLERPCTDAADHSIKTKSDTLIGMPFNSPAPSQTWKTQALLSRKSPSGPARQHAYSADHVFLDAQGAGANDPNLDDYGRTTSVVKSGFPSPSSAIGGVGGQLVMVRQAGPRATSARTQSDTNGIQLNVYQSGDPGFLAGIEGTIGRLDPTNYSTTHALTIQIAGIDPYGKNQEQGLDRWAKIDQTMFGYLAKSHRGQADRAFYATNNGPGNTWQDYAYFGDSGAPKFRVKGAGAGSRSDGAIVLGPDSGSVTLAKDAANRLTVQSTGGAALPVQTIPTTWRSYIPAVTASSGTLTSTMVDARYQVVGKRLDLRATVKVTAAGTGAGTLQLTLPDGVLPADGPICTGSGRAASTGRGLAPYVRAGSRVLSILTADNTSVVEDNARVDINLSCEIQ